ncbi:unnamed protein product [Protopolystoma xenopodis]|uniref:Uncharacterized protein n=1 Tax=Protopolystoma xenopodis TaxID=117903 RepID=A0A3S5AGF4_9PLAT|nr:unnamed protein product [Protopolystoma xenopodis]
MHDTSSSTPFSEPITPLTSASSSSSSPLYPASVVGTPKHTPTIAPTAGQAQGQLDLSMRQSASAGRTFGRLEPQLTGQLCRKVLTGRGGRRLIVPRWVPSLSSRGHYAILVGHQLVFYEHKEGERIILTHFY